MEDDQIEVRLRGRQELLEQGFCPERGCKKRYVRHVMYAAAHPPSAEERLAWRKRLEEHLDALERHGMCPACARRFGIA